MRFVELLLNYGSEIGLDFFGQLNPFLYPFGHYDPITREDARVSTPSIARNFVIVRTLFTAVLLREQRLVGYRVHPAFLVSWSALFLMGSESF